MKISEIDQHLLEKPDIGTLTDPRGSIIGSRPIALRRRNDDGSIPDPDDPTQPPPPPPSASAPDLALQFLPCLEAVPVPPGFDIKKAVIDAIRQGIGPDADIRYACIQDSGRIGIWLRPSGSTTVDAARDRGMNLINVLKPGETFATWVNGSNIRSQATAAWDASPKRLDHDGNAKADGPVHLTGFGIEFKAPDKVVTKITGYDESPWPDVDFTLTVTDTFSISGSDVHVESKTDLDTDTSFITILTGVFFVLGTFVNPVFFIPAIGFGAERIIIGSVSPGDRGGGAGAVAAENIPKEVFIEKGQKIVALYSRAEVNSGGIVAGGIFLVVDRIPLVSIHGPTQIAVNDGTTSVTKAYQIVTDDLRGALQVQWSGGGAISRPNALVTNVTFDTAGLAPGQSAQKFVHVHVTDVDGLTADAQLTVTIHMARDADTTLPPVCRVKPWLPQCQLV